MNPFLLPALLHGFSYGAPLLRRTERQQAGSSAVRKAAMDAGAWGCVISGAGPSLLALCPPEKGRAVAEAMEKSWEREGVQTRALPLKLQSGGSRWRPKTS